jgi:hypothetical protein
MTHPFFDMLGLDNPWPKDRVAELEKKAARIKNFMQRVGDAMVRCRCKIERLRQKVDLTRSDRGGRMLEVCEARYQQLLSRMARAKQKLAELRDDLQSLKRGGR